MPQIHAQGQILLGPKAADRCSPARGPVTSKVDADRARHEHAKTLGRASGGAREKSVTSRPSSLGAFASLAMLLLCAPPDLQQALSL